MRFSKAQFGLDGEEYFGGHIIGNAGATETDDNLNGASVARFIPFVVQTPTTITALAILLGNVSAGHVDVGIYTSEGNRIMRAYNGSDIPAGTANTLQVFDSTNSGIPASTVLVPGLYFTAMVGDDTSCTIRGMNLSRHGIAAAGVYNMAAAYPLPNPAVFAISPIDKRAPLIIISQRAQGLN
jgi:hypothetical protein